MSFYDHWQAQKLALKNTLQAKSDVESMTYQIRHALLQAEQDTLAEIGNEVLRQQAGLLIAQLKGSVQLLEVRQNQKVWFSHRSGGKTSHRLSVWIPMALLTLLTGYCFYRSDWTGILLSAGAMVLLGIVLLQSRKKPAVSEPEIQVDITPDVNSILNLLDGQAKNIDRYISDLSYLNEACSSSEDAPNPQSASRAADLAEAIYECEPDSREALEEPVLRLLESVGLKAVEYSVENRQYFSVLPSKNVTQTVSPAILSAQDGKLLKRGTAAVKGV